MPLRWPWKKRKVQPREIHQDGEDRLPVYTNVELQELSETAWARVDPEIRAKARQILLDALAPEDVEAIRKNIAEFGSMWMDRPPFSVSSLLVEHDAEGKMRGPGRTIHYGWHMSGGMAVRNCLRKGGITDDMLPPFDAYYGPGTNVRNWDDYYVQAVEHAVAVD